MTSAQPLPQLELFHRMAELPVIELALANATSTYERLKASHQLLHWALSQAESSLGQAGRQAAPYVGKLETPISYVDHTLCRGLDQIERRVPIVKDRPELILEKSYMLAVEKMQPAVSTMSYANDFVTSHASSIKNMSWNKMNEILSTQYGIAAVHGLDLTACLVEIIIDKYFPPIGEEKFSESVSIDEDKLLHTLQTVGRLSNKAARRVYLNVAQKLRTLSKDGLRAYLASLVEFLRLAHYVDAVNERLPATVCSAASSPAGSIKTDQTSTTEATASAETAGHGKAD